MNLPEVISIKKSPYHDRIYPDRELPSVYSEASATSTERYRFYNVFNRGEFIGAYAVVTPNDYPQTEPDHVKITDMHIRSEFQGLGFGPAIYASLFAAANRENQAVHSDYLLSPQGLNAWRLFVEWRVADCISGPKTFPRPKKVKSNKGFYEDVLFVSKRL